MLDKHLHQVYIDFTDLHTMCVEIRCPTDPDIDYRTRCYVSCDVGEEGIQEDSRVQKIIQLAKLTSYRDI